MIDAPSGISGSAFCTVKRRPFTLPLKSESKCSSVILPRGATFNPPALANTISSLPFSRLICAKRRSRSQGLRLLDACYIFSISLTAAPSSASRRPVMKRYAPSFTNCFAVARPMPLLPPVMSSIFPSSLSTISSPSSKPIRLLGQLCRRGGPQPGNAGRRNECRSPQQTGSEPLPLCRWSFCETLYSSCIGNFQNLASQNSRR